ncbi:hypothetical protein N9878_02285 [bacterium]|nr:hypothetical protein [bacterium]
MTVTTIDKSHGWYGKVNGRARFFAGISNITKVSPSTATVTAGGKTFEVFGGRASGGASHEWFIEYSGGTIKCSSLVDALNVLNG